jgi:hypothetical protein
MTAPGYLLTKSTRVRTVRFSPEWGNSADAIWAAYQSRHGVTVYPSEADGFGRLD